MSTRDTRPGSTGGADVPGPLYGGPDDDYTPEQLAAMSREELDRLGARYDGVEIVHVDPGPEPGSPMEKRAIRQVGLRLHPRRRCSPSCSWSSTSARAGSCPTGTGRSPRAAGARSSPRCSACCLGLSLLCVGVGLVLFTKKLLPHEIAVQDRHDGSHFDRRHRPARRWSAAATTAAWPAGKLITRSLAASWAAASGLMLIMPLGGLIKNPNKGNPLGTTDVRARGRPAGPRRRHARSAPATRSPARWRRSSRASPAATSSPTRRRC